ncbi:aspartate carbamoyltransferase regulatory subunit [Natronolimnohabitans innermongolicus]|uniref:Aspartate carbamoyltransferase regulatory chain n=1 Tax=Natronolimnohabitans innermongolicus JCM 12255 TaxID=1227499 RepID=L9XJ36_9EURY|nr:aspartate carbamoyltransferase regulatory subunit [Natronolimnohabitans innermongolicus]ELY61769.1 aspartate carbamoyltransferase regulatory subunit [Natronolimnohabitans innermongolicus JCM 12255]
MSDDSDRRDDEAGDARNTREDHQLRVSKIRDGTVIDHVRGGQALNVLAILGIDGSEGEELSVGMNVPSDRLARKDIVKVEGRELSQDEVDVLSLIAPDATINIVRDYEVIEKHRVERPEVVEGVLSCPNSGCITTGGEPVSSRFDVLSDGVRCAYCETIVRDGIAALIDT